jgi:hypothetical protein
VGLKLNGAHQLLAYAKDVNSLGDNTETLTDGRKEFGLKVNIDKSTHMLVSRHQNAGQDRNINIGNRLYENVHGSTIWERQ